MPLGFGRRKDDEPPSPFGGNAREVRGVPGAADPSASRPGDAPSVPGSDARVVGRPRIVALVGWILMVAIGVGMALTGGTGAVIFGVVWTVCLGGLFLALLRSRVVVDGHNLYFRTVRGWGEPVDLSHLRSASVVTGTNFAQWVVLRDRGGHEAQIDAVNLRLKRLYRELAIYIGPWQDIADDRLERRIAPHR